MAERVGKDWPWSSGWRTAMSEPMDDPRLAELRASLAETRERISHACSIAGRRPQDVTLVVVTKTWPVADIHRLAHLGVTDVGENRDQEAAPKHAASAELDLVWHFIGQLQTNKARSVARYADIVESVDRPSLVRALDAAAAAAQRRLSVLIQIDLTGGGEGRGGIDPPSASALAEQICSVTSLDLRGVMAVAPLEGDPRAAFDRLAVIHEEILRVEPTATIRSAGMSEDLAAGIAAGATHVRVGRGILGSRPLLG
jgi:hypothetical protein